jgi:signal transduction histidine kinase
MQELINKTIDEVRYLAFQLRPGSLDHLGLKEALESLISDFEKRTDIIYTYKKSEIPLLDNTTSTAIYRIVQEAITNAIRHASPKRINVGLFFKDGVVSLEISDDGIGFDVEEKKQNGLVFGILGMQERAELVGGRLHIFSKKGKGTTIIGRFPINKS